MSELDDEIRKMVDNRREQVVKTYQSLRKVVDTLPNSNEKTILELLSSVFNLLENSFTFQQVIIARISDLDQTLRAYHRELFGDKAIQIEPSKPLNEHTLQQSVENLNERFEKTFGSLDNIINKINKQYYNDQEKSR